ncbi:hypothetical protein Mal15_26020 [Stieleria maiorica]|uniref:Uncharacterized protein n=1 Tax=Stieleria maiorica TaxID=2795974 RepID=A0A5B9MEY2_9BACT|nr:hypothetical protein Mal15_26020 [Stieleria maiorica]
MPTITNTSTPSGYGQSFGFRFAEPGASLSNAIVDPVVSIDKTHLMSCKCDAMTMICDMQGRAFATRFCWTLWLSFFMN